MRDTRRTTLKKITISTIPISGLPVQTQSRAKESQVPAVDLLPADNAVSGEIGETTSPDSTVSIDGDTTATRTGTLSSTLDGTLDGEGQLALSASPYLETRWTAPSDGLYRIIAGYSVTVGVEQNAFSNETTELASTLVANSGTVDSTRTVVRDRSRQEWSLRNREYSDETLEQLLGVLANRLVSPYLGPLGGTIAGFILSVVLDLLIDSRAGSEIQRTWEEQVSSDFEAEAGDEYTLRFTPVCGISGQSTGSDGGFNANISIQYSLNTFRLEGVSGQPENEIVIYPAGNGGNYTFSVTGSLRGGSNLDYRDNVDTVSPLFSEEEYRQASGSVRSSGEADTYYYTGELDEWSLFGSAKVFINGERWFPRGGGPDEHELRIEYAGDGGYYTFSVSHSLRGGPDLDFRDRVDTVSPLFSDEEYRQASGSVNEPGETDTYYFTGEISDWSLSGSAKMYINDERWFPH